MDGFLAAAAAVFETACCSQPSPGSLEELGIVVGSGGQLRIVDAAGWSVAALREEWGATAVYCVRRDRSNVRIEAASDTQSCVLSARGPAQAARMLLGPATRSAEEACAGLLPAGGAAAPAA